MALVKHYSLFDTVAKEHTRVITSQNDETACRSLEYIVRDKNFDRITGKDLVLVHVYDFDSSTGQVVNNDVKTISALATVIAKVDSERLMEAALEVENHGTKGNDGKKGKSKEGK